MAKKLKFDPFPTTVLPFFYDPKEWEKPPKLYLMDYIREHDVYRYKIIYEGDPISGYYSSLIICGRKFSASTIFETVQKSRENIIILTLLNCTAYCDTAEELQNLIISACSKTKKYKPHCAQNLAKSNDSIFRDKKTYSKAVKIEQRNSQEVSFLPKIERLSIIVGAQHTTESQDMNLSMDEFKIDGIIFKADKEKVTVNIVNKSVLKQLSTKNVIKLGFKCYEIPYKFYYKQMGRACWVFNIGVSEDPVHIHPSKIITNKENFIHLESQYIPEDKRQQCYNSMVKDV